MDPGLRRDDDLGLENSRDSLRDAGRMALTPALPSREPLVQLDDIRLTLQGAAGAVDILRGISLAIMHGETVALVGPSGSGKSSLMMVIAGIERPSAGRVVVAGQDLAALDENGLARLRRHHVGIVFQSFHLLPTMTARENVAIPLELAGNRNAFALAEAALARVGLGHRLGIIRGSFPAASSSASRSRAPLSPARRCCWPTSRPAISTARPASRSSTICSTSMPGSARRYC